MRTMVIAGVRPPIGALVAVLTLACCAPAMTSPPTATAPAPTGAATLDSGSPAEDSAELRTQDGFRLTFRTRPGRFSRLELPGYSADLSQGAELGVYLYDPQGARLLDANSAPLTGYRIGDNEISLARANPARHISVQERWRAYRNHIGLDATITTTERPPRSRGVEACVQLPLDMIGKQWYGDLSASEVIEQRSEPYKTILTELVDIGAFGDGNHHMKSELDFNLNGVNLIGDSTFGLAIALNPEQPAAYYVRYDTNVRSYDACFHLGIDKDHIQNHNSVSFSVSFFSPDNADWGMRSALHKYITIYPQSFGGSLPRMSGMVVGDTYNYKAYHDPGIFHIEAVWGTYKSRNKENGVYDLVYLWPTGFYDRDMRMKAEAGSPGGDRSWEADIAVCLQILLHDTQPF